MTARRNRYPWMYPALLLFALLLILSGLLLDGPAQALRGLRTIVLSDDMLITDYMAIAGRGAALLNAGLVAACAVLVLHLSRDPVNGVTISIVGLMAGFALFGKNVLNIWPIIGGAYLYALVRREPFAKYAAASLLATTLSPVISVIALRGGPTPLRAAAGVLVGVVIGFVLMPLSSATYAVQKGMNLYNMGFAAGLLAMVLVPVMVSYGAMPAAAFHWSTGNNRLFAPALYGLCALLAAAGLCLDRRAPRRWLRLLRTSGRVPSDYLRMFDTPVVLLNIAVNGVIATTLLLAVGGDLNGPTIGGIFAVMCFGSNGEHALNILPVMLGVVLGGLTKQWELTDGSAQLALLFCTTLAPFSGHFGWPVGVAAGFLHSSVALRAGLVLEGLNLYNNGFSGGLVSLVLYPLINAFLPRHRHDDEREAYFALFEETGRQAVPGADEQARPFTPPAEQLRPREEETVQREK